MDNVRCALLDRSSRGGYRGDEFCCTFGCINKRRNPPMEGEATVDDIGDMLEDPDQTRAVGEIHGENDVQKVDAEVRELARIQRSQDLQKGTSAIYRCFMKTNQRRNEI